MHNCQHTFTITNPTLDQLNAIHAIVSGQPEAAALKKKAGKPGKTVSPDEDEDFAKDAVDEDELEENDEDEEEAPVKKKASKKTKAKAEESEDEDDSDEESEESEDDEDGLAWEDVKAVMNKYGAKHPEETKAILLGFNLKSSKELEKHKTKWEPVYRKIMAKLKASKKAGK